MNFRALDGYLDTFYREKNIPGVGVAVSVRGRIVHEHYAGYADVEKGVPFAGDTVFNLYSATKISTVTAAMRLVDRGILGLDEPAGKYLPEMDRVTVRQADGSVRPAENTMRVRHLLSMTAGFGYGNAPSVERLKRDTGGRPTTRQVVAALAEEPLCFEPGTHFRYSFCHDVLAALMEEAAGLAFDEILQREVFGPLGMKDTGFTVSDEQAARMALEYHGFDAGTGMAEKVLIKYGHDMGMGPVYRSGGGGLMSTVRDYARLAAMLGNGGVTGDGERILSAGAVAAMQENQLGAEAQEDFDRFGGWSKAGYGYGLGVRTLVDPERNNALSERGEFGWDGALGCYLAADPASGVGIFYAQQEGGSRWYTWHGRVRNFAYAGILGGEDLES